MITFLALWGLIGAFLLICLPVPKTKWGSRFSLILFGPIVWLFLPVGYLRVRHKIKERRKRENGEFAGALKEGKFCKGGRNQADPGPRPKEAPKPQGRSSGGSPV